MAFCEDDTMKNTAAPCEKGDPATKPRGQTFASFWEKAPSLGSFSRPGGSARGGSHFPGCRKIEPRKTRSSPPSTLRSTPAPSRIIACFPFQKASQTRPSLPIHFSGVPLKLIFPLESRTEWCCRIFRTAAGSIVSPARAFPPRSEISSDIPEGMRRSGCLRHRYAGESARRRRSFFQGSL